MCDSRRTRTCWVLLAGCMIAAWTLAAFGQEWEATDPLLPRNDNPSATIDVRLGTDKTTLKPGDEITLWAKADKDCYLTVLHLGSSGKVTMLWPNEGSHWDDKVSAGQKIDVPGPDAGFKIGVDGKQPFERIAAYATAKKDRVFQPSNYKLKPDAKVKVFVGNLRDLTRAFRSHVTRLSEHERWGTAELSVKIGSEQPPVVSSDADPCQSSLVLKEESSKPLAKTGFTTRELGEKALESMESELLSRSYEGRIGSSGLESVRGFRQPETKESIFETEESDLEMLDVKYPDIPKSVCGKDERVRQSPCKETPWRWNCFLLVTWPNGDKGLCTGWLIGPRTVMTAGHCVYSHEQKGWAKKIEVAPGADGRARPYGTQTSSDFRSVDKWIQESNNQFDFGAIILPNDKFGKELGYFGFQSLSGKSIKESELNTSGYPGDKPKGTQWFMGGPVSNVNCGEIGYMIDTYGGQSGSPVWAKMNDQRIAVGIHVRGGCPNKATRIRKPVFDMMMHWKDL